MKELIRNIRKKVNRKLNSTVINNKVFCIGLHKTGTTSLADFFSEYGFHSIHATDWIGDTSKLNRFDFFSDGGSHFDNINELDFERLFHTYKKSKFILQTRDTEKWVISKLKHAGWNQDTVIQKDDASKLIHSEWTYKSLLTLQHFITHKYNYEKKVVSFFKENDPSRLIVVDITENETRTLELKKLKIFLKLRSLNNINVPHSNKRSSKILIPETVHAFIKETISKHNN